VTTPARDAAPGPYAVRVALALGETVLAERQIAAGEAVTIGHAPSCTFVVPDARSLAQRGRRVLLEGPRLQLLDGLGGRVTLGGQPRELAELRRTGATITLAPEDWGVLTLDDAPELRIVVQHVRAELLPPLPGDGGARPLLATTGLSALGFAILMVIAFLSYDPAKPELSMDEVSDRFAKVMFNRPEEPPPIPDEEPTVSDEDAEAKKQGKRAGGDEGKFGRPDRKGPSNVPKRPDAGTSMGTNVGLVKEMNTLSQSGAMSSLLAVGGEVGTAISGMDDGELLMGGGNYGMSTRGSGGGGGGEGVGVLYGKGDEGVDVGGGDSESRKKAVKGAAKPTEKKVSVERGQASVKGQLSKELIDKEVRRHTAQIKYCYEKQLTRFPTLSGKVTLSWIIAMDGSVKSAKIQSSSLGNSDAESCLVRSLEKWVFPKPQGGVVQVAYPFSFGAK
jgi:hypothetical protein